MRVLIFLFAFFLTTPAFAKMQQTTWHPDTCDCKVVYEWDNSVPQEERTHTAVEVTDYIFTGTKEQKYQKILEENQRKNISIGEIKKTFPNIDDSLIEFYYDQNRKLHLKVNLPPQEKATAQDNVNKKVGNEKVILE